MSDIDYRLVPTAVGRAEFANAAILKRGVDLTHMAVGDGGGVIEPVHGDMTALVNEVYRAEINAISAGNTPGHIIVELVIPADVGGWVIREAGVFTADGALVGVANYPPTTKPLLTSGGGVEEHIRAHLLLTEAEAGTILLKVDPTMVLSTRQHVSDKIDEHDAAPDAHANLLASVNEHAGRTDNPHGTTAAQVGAAPSGHGHEMDEVSGLADALDGRASKDHGHSLAAVVGAGRLLNLAVEEPSISVGGNSAADINLISGNRFVRLLSANYELPLLTPPFDGEWVIHIYPNGHTLTLASGWAGKYSAAPDSGADLIRLNLTHDSVGGTVLVVTNVSLEA